MTSRWNSYDPEEIPTSLRLFPIINNYLSKDSRVLDIGCGSGKVAFDLAICGYIVDAVDINEKAVRHGNAEAHEKNVSDRLRFQAADAVKLPFADGMFDMAILQAFLTTIAVPLDRQRVIAEVHRVLRPGKFLYLVDFAQNWHLDVYRERYLRDVEKTNEEGSFISYNIVSGEPEYVAHHFTEKELVFLLINNGFCIDYFKIDQLTTKSGNTIYGYIIMGKKI